MSYTFDPETSPCLACTADPSVPIPDLEEWCGHRNMRWKEITLKAHGLTVNPDFRVEGFSSCQLFACSECGTLRVEF